MSGAGDISKAYHAGYEQGVFDTIANIPHSLEKGYSVVAAVRCGECCHYEDIGICQLGQFNGERINIHQFCSYGEKEDKPCG